MVIKGSARGGAASLAKHLARTDTNEKMEVRELRGVCAEELTDALLEMEAVASGARTKRPFYHASINTRADEILTPEQEQRAIDRLEEELGLKDQARAVVAHVKEGRAHLHVVWSRIDLETMKAIPDSHNYRRHELVARELEREFGHERVQGAHIEREGVPRPERTPTHAEMMQAERTGLTPQEAKAAITALWQRTDDGKSFAAALNEEGWILAAGDRRDFVVVDRHGEPHSLARRVEGAKAAEIRARLADLDRDALPSVAEARALQEERAAREPERDGKGPPANLDRDPAVTAGMAWDDRVAAAAIDQAKAQEQQEAAARKAEAAKAVLTITPAAVRADLAAEKAQERAEATRARDAAGEARWRERAEDSRAAAEKPKPEGGAPNVAGGVAKLADGVANLAGGVIDFFVDGPPKPPTPAEQERQAEAAAAKAAARQAEDARADAKRQAGNALAQGQAKDVDEDLLAQLLGQSARDHQRERERDDDHGRERTR